MAFLGYLTSKKTFKNGQKYFSTNTSFNKPI